MSDLAIPESARMDSGRKESGRISDSSNPESGRKKSSRNLLKKKSGGTSCTVHVHFDTAVTSKVFKFIGLSNDGHRHSWGTYLFPI
jgi:hypothetical protein